MTSWIDRTWCEDCKTFVKIGMVWEYCVCPEFTEENHGVKKNE
jgi:hypothetical protein